jgi:hypothetical protein
MIRNGVSWQTSMTLTSDAGSIRIWYLSDKSLRSFHHSRSICLKICRETMQIPPFCVEIWNANLPSRTHTLYTKMYVLSVYCSTNTSNITSLFLGCVLVSRKTLGSRFNFYCGLYWGLWKIYCVLMRWGGEIWNKTLLLKRVPVNMVMFM